MFDIVFLSPYLGIFSILLGGVGLYFFYKSFQFILPSSVMKEYKEIFSGGKIFFSLFFVILLGIILSFSFIFLNPNKIFQTTKNTQKGIDIVLVLDLSYSMLAKDIEPNRIEKSKEVLKNFLSQLQSDRVGLVIFAGKPFSGVPLTSDYDFLQEYVKNLDVDSINQNFPHLQGTAVGDALLYGVKTFDESNREKVIVLFTDGEANKGIRPIDALKYVKEKNITVHTVGIGGYEDTFVEFENVYGKQKVEIGGVDEETLKVISDATKGKYYRASDGDSFSQLFKQLDLLEKKDVVIEKTQLFTPIYKNIYFFLVGLFLFFFGFFGLFYIKN